MKRIATKVLIAAALAAGACGVAQAHTGLSIGLGIGVPGPVYTAPQPVYGPQPYYEAQPAYVEANGGWHGRRDWGHRHWDHDRGYYRHDGRHGY